MRNKTKVLVLGANGRIARLTVTMLAEASDVELTLFARDTSRLPQPPAGAKVVEGDVRDRERLAEAVRGQDIVYANLAADIDVLAERVVEAMTHEGVSRLIFVASLGIHDEVPGAFGRWNEEQIGETLRPYRAAAATVQASSLSFTILRPAWLTDADEVDYELTQRDEPFKGTEVSRKSVAALIVEIVHAPDRWIGASLGIDKPGTDGDRPAFV
ncbi:MAG TPA: SDR family oxidoreductase [Gaiellaceae bacterium]|nr:SDR family oxidoreductase [Gaiellaceae bacterium]